MPPSSSGPSRQSKRQRRVPSTNTSISSALAVSLAASIVLGLLFAWTPQFWGISLVQIGVLLTAAAWLYLTSDIQLPLPSGFLAIVAIWGWLQVVWIGTATPASSRKLALEWTVAVIAFCLASNVLRRSAARVMFLAIIVWSASILSILAILQMYSSPTEVLWLFPAQPLTIGTFLYKNQFAAMIEMAMPISLYWTLFDSDKRSEGIFCFLALFAGVIASGSRAGAALVVLECIVAILLAYRKKRISFAIIALLIPAVGTVLAITGYLVGNEFVWAHFQESYRDSARQELFQSNFEMVKAAPWSGYGLGSWSTIYPKFATFDVGRFANAAHNDWMEWAIEGGLLFVGSLLAFVIATIRLAIQSVWGLGVIAMALHSWVDYPSREPVLCILWFCLAAAVLQNRKKVESAEKIPAVGN